MVIGSILQTKFLQPILGTSRTAEILNLAVLLLLLILFWRFVLSYLYSWTLDILDYRRLAARKLIFLEVTPPGLNSQNIQAAIEWVRGMHGLMNRKPRKQRWLKRKHVLPLEIVATRREGIRYIVPLAPYNAEVFKQLLVSYMPSIKFKEVEDYLPAKLADSKPMVTEFTQAGPFSIPILTSDNLALYDPVNYILGAMSRPGVGEVVALQVVVSPASRKTAERIRHQLLSGQEAISKRPWWVYPILVVGKILQAVFSFIGGILEMLSEDAKGIRRTPTQTTVRTNYGGSNITPSTQHVLPDIHEKLDQPLFYADIRTLVIGEDKAERTSGIAQIFDLFHKPGYQGLPMKRNWPRRLFDPYRLRSFQKRLPGRLTRKSSVLAANEVASLYHFPFGQTSTENLIKSHAKSLPVPAELKARADDHSYDVYLGVNYHHDLTTPIGLTAEERERHVYIVGGTGNGKTTMIKGALVQDIKNGKGVAVIDPHGDLAEELLGYIPKSRIKDVIYFDPYDIAHPIGLNLLELPSNLSADELAHQKEFLTEAIVSIFRKVFSEDDTGGHRIESILRNAIHTAFTVPDATLFTVYDLLTDPDFRKGVVAKLTDKRLKQFWNNQFAKAGNMQMVKMISGVTTKLERFDRSESVRRVIGQTKSTIDFDDIINSGKILICKFAKGAIGNDTAELFGIATIAKLQLAAQRRIHMKPAKRQPFYLYVDEFQNFATETFVELLAEARKFKLFLTMAEQSTAQQDNQNIVHIILDNVGTIICFRFGSPQSERLLLPLFKPYIETGEISKLSSYNFYMSLRALDTQEPFSGETMLLKDKSSDRIARQVIEESRKRYASVYKPPEEDTKSSSKEPKNPKDDNNSGVKRKAVGRKKKNK